MYDIFSGFSLPSDLEIIDSEKLAYNMQNLEVENAMLKNELNVMNREISELLDRLRITEDGMDSIVFIYIRYISFICQLFLTLLLCQCV